jgi:ArsR family transcriptional regulator
MDRKEIFMQIDKEILDENARILKALAHPTRLCIVKGLLDQGSNNVSYIQSCLDIPQSTLSQHLSRLKSVGIIDSERNGTEVYYKVIDLQTIKIVRAIFEK